MWDEDAGTQGDWFAYGEEVETMDAFIHAPKDWDDTGPAFTDGGPAYPLAFRHADGSDRSDFYSINFGTHGPRLFDPQEGVLDGEFMRLPLEPNVDEAGEIDPDDPLSTRVTTNGRFWGVLHLPEGSVRALPVDTDAASKHYGYRTGTLVSVHEAKACTEDPTFTWWGRSWDPGDCPSPFGEQVGFGAPRLIPYVDLPLETFRINGGWVSVQESFPRLTLRLEPPAGPTVKVTADLDCVSTGSACVS